MIVSPVFESRLPVGSSAKTMSGSFVKAREKSAALCYGASMYRPDKDPHVITLRRGAD